MVAIVAVGVYSHGLYGSLISTSLDHRLVYLEVSLSPSRIKVRRDAIVLSSKTVAADDVISRIISWNRLMKAIRSSLCSYFKEMQRQSPIVNVLIKLIQTKSKA